MANNHHVPSGPKEELDTLGRWLLSLSPEETQLLLHTREFRELQQAAQNLESVHRHIQIWPVAETVRDHEPATGMICEADNTSRRPTEQVATTEQKQFGRNLLTRHGTCSFMQHLVSDEILMRIFGFVECQTLVRLSSTCEMRSTVAVLMNAANFTPKQGELLCMSCW